MRYFVSCTLIIMTLTAQTHQPSVHILCYHAFIESTDKYSFSLQKLEEHIQYLKKNNYTFVTLNDILQDNVFGNKNVFFSVDDGNRSVYTAYYRVFKKYNIKPLLAVYPAVISKKKYALTWEQLKQLSSEGCEVAAHGFYHLKLDTSLFVTNPKAFSKEIYYSKKLLEQKLGKSVNIFVYPYGIRCDKAIAMVKKAGYSHAFTIDRGGLAASGTGGPSNFEIPRYMLTKYTDKKSFNEIANNAFQRDPEVEHPEPAFVKNIYKYKEPGAAKRENRPDNSKLLFALKTNTNAASRLLKMELNRSTLSAQKKNPASDQNIIRKYRSMRPLPESFFDSLKGGDRVKIYSINTTVFDDFKKVRISGLKNNIRKEYVKHIKTTSKIFTNYTNHFRKRIKQKGHIIRRLYTKIFK